MIFSQEYHGLYPSDNDIFRVSNNKTRLIWFICLLRIIWFCHATVLKIICKALMMEYCLSKIEDLNGDRELSFPFFNILLYAYACEHVFILFMFPFLLLDHVQMRPEVNSNRFEISLRGKISFRCKLTSLSAFI